MTFGREPKTKSSLARPEKIQMVLLNLVFWIGALVALAALVDKVRKDLRAIEAVRDEIRRTVH